MDVFRVKTPGGFTTVQDLGRFGYQRMGVPVCGALDPRSARIANLLVNNPENAAVLEITVMGPTLEVLAEADVALCGAEMGMKVNGEAREGWTAFRVRPGDVLDVLQVRRGCRAYLAVTGGFDAPLTMGSRSTYVGGKLGGFSGRPLAAGDVLPAGPGALLAAPRAVDPEFIPEFPTEITLRVIPGPQDDFFDEGMATLLSSDYMVTPKADRMGYRLMGPKIPIKPGMPKSIVSEPSMPGGIQIPADEQPIILLVEQTVGGYAKIATVIATDLPKIAQATPGDTIRFTAVDLETAHAAYREQEAGIRILAERLGGGH